MFFKKELLIDLKKATLDNPEVLVRPFKFT